MAYKTLMVHLNEEHRADGLIAGATALAKTFGAHLVGLCVLPPIIIVPGAEGGGGAVIEDHRDSYRSQMTNMRDAFAGKTKAAGVSAEWREIDAQDVNPFGDVGSVVVMEARSADLVIAGQENPEWLLSGQLDVIEPLILESGRPVLLLPRAPQARMPAARILAAWDGRREATRAIYDAMPFLQSAQRVDLVSIDETATAGKQLPNISATLQRHGVKSEPLQTIKSDGNVGAALLEKAQADGCDMLVMGCYGHSRLREFVFGGASRHVLEHMNVPILMSH